MTDNEIMKALNEAVGLYHIRIASVRAVDIVDLINRQQSEIKRLERFNKEYKFCNLLGNVLVYSKNLKDYNDMRNGLISYGATKFAERLKERAFGIGILRGEQMVSRYVVDRNDIDNIVKELEGKK